MALAATTACVTVPLPEGPVLIATGQRVRITLSSRVATGPLQGSIRSLSPDTLVVLREEGGERRLTRSQIDRIEVSVTQVRDPMRAAGYGILAGAPLLIPLAIVLPLVAAEYGADASAVLLVLVPVAALAAVGAIIGSGPQDVWVEAMWTALDVVPADSVGAENR
jgi:hypothetical protein